MSAKKVSGSAKNTKKIVIFCGEYFPPRKFNAYHKRLLNLALGLNKVHDVILVCPNDKYKSENASYEGIDVHYLPYRNIPLLKKVVNPIFYPRLLEELLDRLDFRPDMLWYDNVYCYNLARKLPYFKMYDIMGILSKEELVNRTMYSRIKSLMYRWMEVSLYKHSDVITTINEQHMKIVAKDFHKRIIVLRDAVDTDTGFDAALADRLKKRYAGRKVLFFVGSFGRDRFRDIMRAFPVLVNKMPEIKIVIAGDGAYLEGYKRLNAEAGIADNFEYLGFVTGKKLNSYIHVSDICFSDDWSYIGFPVKVYEYMAMGKAILVEDTPAVREVVVENRNGVLYKDADDFVKKVVLLSKDKILKDRLCKNAKIEAGRNTWKYRQDEFNAMVDTLIAKTRATVISKDRRSMPDKSRGMSKR